MHLRKTTKFAVGAVSASLAAAGIAAGAAASPPEDAGERPAAAVDHVGEHLPDPAADEAREASMTTGKAEATHGASVSAVATDPELTGAAKGEAVSTVAKGDHGRPDHATGDSAPESGSIDTPAPVDTPNGGGVGTGTEASEGANEDGATHADDAATLGSGNAGGRP